jgi:hypothetical protein
MRKNRGAKNAHWIEKYCLIPSGADRGRRVRLTQAQRETIARIYDGNEIVEVAPPLSAWLALLHLCGPEAVLDVTNVSQPRFHVDLFTTWSASGPDLKGVLMLQGDHIVCPELGTRYPAAA